MTGVQFVSDEKGRKVAGRIDLRKHGARIRKFLGRVDFGIAPWGKRNTLEKIKADLVKRFRLRE